MAKRAGEEFAGVLSTAQHCVNRIAAVLHGIELKIQEPDGHIFRRMTWNAQLTRSKKPGVAGAGDVAMVKKLQGTIKAARCGDGVDLCQAWPGDAVALSRLGLHYGEASVM